MRSGRRAAAKVVALVVYIIVILVATPQAQQRASFTGAPGAVAGGPAPSTPNATPVDLLVGRSTIINVASPIARVSLTVPDIADAMVTAPQQLLVHGKTPGVISLFVWDRAGGITTYEVNVRRDLSQLIDQMKQLFPGEPIAVAGSGKDVVLAGTVSSKYVVDKAAAVATGYVEKPENVVNLLKQQEGVASNQVMLRVRFAEVSRSALQELGASFIVNGLNSQWFGRTTTQQFPAPDFDSSKPGGLTFSDFLNVFLFNSKHDIGTVIKALSSKGLFESLAEPNLIASNGKEASFLAGGEYPYPIVQPGSGGNAITITFKEFGIRLNFTPTVLGGDLIDLKVRPEVSSLDFSNGIVLEGFRVPALSTRRTDTEVELQDGQTFAIAGLMNNTVNNTMQKIPGIGDIPVLGYLFKSRAYQKNQTELVVMITPQILRKGSTGVSPTLPGLVEPFMPPSAKTLPPPAPWNPGATPSASNQQPAPVAPVAPSNNQPALAQAPVSEPAPAPVTTTASAASKPVKATKAEKEAMERAQKQHDEQQKQAAKQAEADRKKAAEQAEVDKKKAVEQAKLDQEAQRKAAQDAKQQAKVQAELDRRQAEATKRQAEIDKKKAEQMAEAQAKLDAARNAYDQQVAKITPQAQPAPAASPKQ
jgi:pilus assembly protein CpaC